MNRMFHRLFTVLKISLFFMSFSQIARKFGRVRLLSSYTRHRFVRNRFVPSLSISWHYIPKLLQACYSQLVNKLSIRRIIASSWNNLYQVDQQAVDKLSTRLEQAIQIHSVNTAMLEQNCYMYRPIAVTDS